MFLLRRLTARGSRALGVMIGTSRKGAGHALCGGTGDPDDLPLAYPSPLCPSLPVFSASPISRFTGSTPGVYLLLQKEMSWIAEHS